jgi:proteasome lid subunit RPN8/RPN11
MMFGPDVEAAARSHALAVFPNESCGVVVVNGYVPIANIAADPAKNFQMPADVWTAHGCVQGVIHSHGPESDLAPSANDMQHQIASDVPWGITRTDGVVASPIMWWGNQRLDDPLLGRAFIHGVNDCYGAIRSWRWQNRQIKLVDFPRDDQWWKEGYDLYREGFAKAGYREITESEAAVGDVALITFRSKVPNHGGTLVDDGLFYHHLQNRLSCREPIGRWRSMISHWLRYEG